MLSRVFEFKLASLEPFGVFNVHCTCGHRHCNIFRLQRTIYLHPRQFLFCIYLSGYCFSKRNIQKFQSNKVGINLELSKKQLIQSCRRKADCFPCKPNWLLSHFPCLQKVCYQHCLFKLRVDLEE